MLYIKNGIIRDKRSMVIEKDGFIVVNPSIDDVIADGWSEYSGNIPDTNNNIGQQLMSYMLDVYNKRIDITDSEALDRPLLIYKWDTYIGKSLKSNQCVSYNNKIYRVRQDINVVLENQYPSMDTAALYEVIELQATGTIDDPIEYVPPMEIFKDKYYIYNGVKYLCTRDSQTALSNGLDQLVNIYVIKVE